MFNSALLSQLGFWRSVITVVRKDSYLWFGGSMLNIVLLTELRKSYVKSGQKLHSRPLAGKLGRSHHSQVHERGDQANVCTRVLKQNYDGISNFARALFCTCTVLFKI